MIVCLDDMSKTHDTLLSTSFVSAFSCIQLSAWPGWWEACFTFAVWSWCVLCAAGSLFVGCPHMLFICFDGTGLTWTACEAMRLLFRVDVGYVCCYG